jgi:hypothetical protein
MHATISINVHKEFFIEIFPKINKSLPLSHDKKALLKIKSQNYT